MSDPVVQQMSVKGKLFKSIQHWQSLGSPDFILSVVRNGHKTHLFPRRRLAVSLTMPRSLKKKILLLRLSWNSCVTIVSRKSGISPPDIINPLAVSLQANGKKRLILVLTHINFHVYKQKFKCGNLHTIKTTFAKDFFLFSLLI